MEQNRANYLLVLGKFSSKWWGIHNDEIDQVQAPYRTMEAHREQAWYSMVSKMPLKINPIGNRFQEMKKNEKKKSIRIILKTLNLTTTILITNIWKSPNIPQINCESNNGQ